MNFAPASLTFLSFRNITLLLQPLHPREPTQVGVLMLTTGLFLSENIVDLPKVRNQQGKRKIAKPSTAPLAILTLYFSYLDSTTISPGVLVTTGTATCKMDGLLTTFANWMRRSASFFWILSSFVPDDLISFPFTIFVYGKTHYEVRELRNRFQVR